MTNSIQTRNGHDDSSPIVRHFNRIMRRRIVDGKTVVFVMNPDHTIHTFKVKNVVKGSHAIITSERSGEDYATIFADGLVA